MKRWLGLVACACLMVLALATRAMALDGVIDAMLHHELEKQVLVIHDSNVKDVEKLSHYDPKKYRICDVQCSPDALSAENAKVLMDWVQAGGSLWFQDCRMAASFGMESDPLSKDETTQSEPKEGPYNTHQKFQGLAVAGFPAGKHEVLTGVLGIVAFLIPVGKDQYSAVKGGGDVIGLIRGTLTPESTNADKMIAAMKTVGNGTVVFKPLVWVESLSSDRFQANLREWVCGYPVPTIENYGGRPLPPRNDATTTQQPQALTTSGTLDTILLDTGETVSGVIQNKAFQFYNTGDMHGADGFERTKVASIDFQGAGNDIITLKDGNRSTGMLAFGDDGDLVVKMKDGSTKHYRKDQIKHVDFAATVPDTKHGRQ